jgi:hypothetical protein
MHVGSALGYGVKVAPSFSYAPPRTKGGKSKILTVKKGST